MIPKRAFFFWSSRKPMSWLRSLSIKTFKMFNPEWQVDLFDDVPLNGMHPVHRSDLFRYEELARNGGVYFDTDIVFFRTFPEELLEYDAMFALHPKHRMNNIGCLMSAPESRLFRDIAERASQHYELMKDVKSWDGQLIGSPMFNRHFFTEFKFTLPELDLDEVVSAIAGRYDINFGVLPQKFVTPVDSWNLHKLYNWTPFDPPRQSIGVHWFGGNQFNSKPYEQRIDESNVYEENCYLSHAIRIALQYEPKRVQ